MKEIQIPCIDLDTIPGKFFDANQTRVYINHNGIPGSRRVLWAVDDPGLCNSVIKGVSDIYIKTIHNR